MFKGAGKRGKTANGIAYCLSEWKYEDSGIDMQEGSKIRRSKAAQRGREEATRKSCSRCGRKQGNVRKRGA